MRFQESLLKINTLGALKKSGYITKSIKEELRDNLIYALQNKISVFSGIHGYEDTVIPDLERAILSMHNINLLGLRGQAKTRIARMMVNLLDEYIPVLEGSELNDNPFRPLSRLANDIVQMKGDEAPIAWLHRSERYVEKLATPDVSIADLIGDVDPIKAATLKLPYSDERVLHFGLIPRAHRCIFVINELPDLQARIQVALFNILQEGDMQIRGFKMRLPLDIQFVFTANPEDYTNRGSIVTPLKDRIDSQILTHYPKSLEISKKITEQEAKIQAAQKNLVEIPDIAKDLIEQIAISARESEYVDAKSGVSARLTISAYENLISAAERRALIHNERKTTVRMGDLQGIIPSITGKIELVYEGEQEGTAIVARNLIGKAVRTLFVKYFPDPEKEKKRKESSYRKIVEWFSNGGIADILNDTNLTDYRESITSIPGVEDFINKRFQDKSEGEKLFMMEFLLYGLSEFSMLSKHELVRGFQFKDLMSGMFGNQN